MEHSSGRASGITAVCPECGNVGGPAHTRQEADGRVVFASLSTRVGIQPFYDQNGKLHQHDDINCHTVLLACVQGHHWRHRFRSSCWCGWPETDTPTTCPTCSQTGGQIAEIEDAHGQVVVDDDSTDLVRGLFDAAQGKWHRSHRQKVEKMVCPAGHTWGERRWYWPCWCGWPEWVRSASAASTEDTSDEP